MSDPERGPMISFFRRAPTDAEYSGRNRHPFLGKPTTDSEGNRPLFEGAPESLDGIAERVTGMLHLRNPWTECRNRSSRDGWRLWTTGAKVPPFIQEGGGEWRRKGRSMRKITGKCSLSHST